MNVGDQPLTKHQAKGAGQQGGIIIRPVILQGYLVATNAISAPRVARKYGGWYKGQV